MITAETAVKILYLGAEAKIPAHLPACFDLDCRVQMFLTGGGSQHTG